MNIYFIFFYIQKYKHNVFHFVKLPININKLHIHLKLEENTLIYWKKKLELIVITENS